MHPHCEPAWRIHCMYFRLFFIIAVLTGLLKTIVEKIVATAIFIPLDLAVVVARSRRQVICTYEVANCHASLCIRRWR